VRSLAGRSIGFFDLLVLFHQGKSTINPRLREVCNFTLSHPLLFPLKGDFFIPFPVLKPIYSIIIQMLHFLPDASLWQEGVQQDSFILRLTLLLRRTNESALAQKSGEGAQALRAEVYLPVGRLRFNLIFFAYFLVSRQESRVKTNAARSLQHSKGIIYPWNNFYHYLQYLFYWLFYSPGKARTFVIGILEVR